MAIQPDPRYFNWGNALQGGIDNAQQNQRRNALLDIERSQEARREGAYQNALTQQQAGAQQAAKQREVYARAFQEAGLDPGVADTEGADELYAYIMQQKVAPPKEPDLMMGPDGRMVPKVAGAMGYIPPRQPPAPIAAEQEYELAKRTGFQGSYLDFVKAKQKEDKPPVAADPALQLQDTKNVLAAIDSADGLIGGNTTGFIGQKLGAIGGTEAYDLRSALDTVKASIGFDRLQRMREESKTGGALGQVAVRELDLLQATIASLDANQSGPQLKSNLKRVRTQYEKAMNAYQKALGGEAASQSGGPKQLSPQEAAQLPSGTRFVGQDGKEYVKR